MIDHHDWNKPNKPANPLGSVKTFTCCYCSKLSPETSSRSFSRKSVNVFGSVGEQPSPQETKQNFQENSVCFVRRAEPLGRASFFSFSRIGTRIGTFAVRAARMFGINMRVRSSATSD